MKRLLLISNSTMHGQQYLEHCGAEIRDFLGDAGTVLFLPFALGDMDQYEAKARQAFTGLGFGLESLHRASDPIEAVNQARAFFTGGGNTFRLLNALYTLGVLAALRARVEEGVPYIGSSAGSNIACLTIKTTNDMPIVYPPSFDALGLVPFSINAHYLDPDPGSKHMGETRDLRIREFHELNRPPVIGLREGSWLRVENREMRLGGTTGAKLFRRGEDSLELSTGDSLDFLLASH